MTSLTTSKLSIGVENGVTISGKKKYANRVFSNVSGTATDENLYSFGKKLAALQGATVSYIRREDYKVFAD